MRQLSRYEWLKGRNSWNGRMISSQSKGLDTLRWYPVHLDGRAMYITRDSGIIDYVKHGGPNPCAKEDSDFQVVLGEPVVLDTFGKPKS